MEERQKSKRKEEEGGRGALRRELQEELYLDKAQEIMAPDPLNTKTTAELERVDSERYHIDGGVGVVLT